MAAESMSAARRTPLVAAFPKMFIPFIVILPGLVARALTKTTGSGYALPLKASGVFDYDQTFPTLLAQFYPSGMLGVGITALMAAGETWPSRQVWAFEPLAPHVVRPSPLPMISIGREEGRELWA